MATVEFITMATIMILGLIIISIKLPTTQYEKEAQKLDKILAQETIWKMLQEAKK